MAYPYGAIPVAFGLAALQSLLALLRDCGTDALEPAADSEKALQLQ
jgi:TRAP-type C4-dicarboxylate transport system permease small subunit